jgi:putative FmdB family regulatory protein
VPIYEYRCTACDAKTAALILDPGDEDAVRCADCGASEIERTPSRFATHKSESQRLAELDPRAATDDAFFADRRNIGLAAKKRARDLGTELGSDFDDAVERARTAKNLDDL